MDLDKSLQENSALDESQKDRVQSYLNFQRAMTKYEHKKFAAEIEAEPLDYENHRKLMNLIVVEEARFLPVIGCAYADDLLKDMFRAAIPKGVPGGAKGMLGGYGPLSSFAYRIQLAYAFNLMSKPLLLDLDRLRSVRNDISHTWSVDTLLNFFEKPTMAELLPVEQLIKEMWPRYELINSAAPLQVFRMRLAMVLTMTAYQAPLYWRAVQRRLEPQEAIYGEHKSTRLGQLTVLVMAAIERILEPGVEVPEPITRHPQVSE
jgi:DNA-binding MltR family transcriptional regulator